MALAAKLVWSSILALSLAASAGAAEPSGVAVTTNGTAAIPSADTMFKLAKGAWRARFQAPFVTYSLRERYTWRGRIHDNWWTAYYRDADRNLVLHRMIVAQDEAARLKGFPIAINLHFHKGIARADSLDTNPNADAFPILDPLIAPDASFGMLATDSGPALVGNRTTQPQTNASATPTASSAPRAVPTASPLLLIEKPLRELAHVEAAARDYRIAFAGTEHLASGDAYHLTLTPLRDPQSYRLRDLWLDPATFATLQLAVQGLFEGKPYDGARWIVSYVAFGGRYYVQEIRAGDSLRFGLDRTVTDLQYDFVSYDFPATLPDSTFRRLL